MLIRRAAPQDALSIARVHVRSWQEGYRGLLPAAFLDALSVEERARRYTFGSTDPAMPATFLVEDDAGICGFATTVPARDADAAGLGELAALYVHPDRWGQGFGAALLSAARHHLKSSRIRNRSALGARRQLARRTPLHFRSLGTRGTEAARPSRRRSH